MKIAALISWYDESPHWLATCVAGVARFCDYIIGHDGAYALYPSARACSHPQQAEAVIQAAEAAGAACMIYRPNEVYRGNEVEKRNAGLRMAGALLEPEEDWLCIVDADFHILRCESEVIRAELASTHHDVASYTLLDGKDMLANEATARFARELDASTEWTYRTRDFYRWTPSLQVGPTHYCYSRERDGERVWLRGPELNVEPEPALDLRANLVFYHRRQDRASVRQKAAKEYYDRRHRFGIENVQSANVG